MLATVSTQHCINWVFVKQKWSRWYPVSGSSCFWSKMANTPTLICFQLMLGMCWEGFWDLSGMKKTRVHWLLIWAMHQEKNGSLQATCAISRTITVFVSEIIRILTEAEDQKFETQCSLSMWSFYLHGKHFPLLSIFFNSFLLSLGSKQAFLCITCFLFFYFMMIICIY